MINLDTLLTRLASRDAHILQDGGVSFRFDTYNDPSAREDGDSFRGKLEREGYKVEEDVMHGGFVLNIEGREAGQKFLKSIGWKKALFDDPDIEKALGANVILYLRGKKGINFKEANKQITTELTEKGMELTFNYL